MARGESEKDVRGRRLAFSLGLQRHIKVLLLHTNKQRKRLPPTPRQLPPPSPSPWQPVPPFPARQPPRRRRSPAPSWPSANEQEVERAATQDNAPARGGSGRSRPAHPNGAGVSFIAELGEGEGRTYLIVHALVPSGERRLGGHILLRGVRFLRRIGLGRREEEGSSLTLWSETGSASTLLSCAGLDVQHEAQPRADPPSWRRSTGRRWSASKGRGNVSAKHRVRNPESKRTLLTWPMRCTRAMAWISRLGCKRGSTRKTCASRRGSARREEGARRRADSRSERKSS